MSIRSLTLRLTEEATEAHKRQSYAPASIASRPQPPARPPQTAFVRSRGGARPASVSEEHSSSEQRPEQNSPQSVRIRSREVDTRWRPPGGIAARFGMRAANGRQPDSAEPAPAESPAVSQPGTNGNTETGARPSGPDESREPETEKTSRAAPITIELQSH